MRPFLIATTAAMLFLASAASFAQTAAPDADAGASEKQAPIPFEGGELTIAQPEEYGEKILSFGGKELARDYVVYFEKVVDVAGTKVALFDVGPGGNACGPAMLLVWKPKDADIRTVSVGAEECGAPPAAVSDYSISFVPYLLPGESKAVLSWTPDSGLMTAGMLSYVPEPKTDWKDIDASKFQNIIDAFHNEAVYEAGRKLLGKDLTEVVTGLLVGGGTEKMASGAIYASGCTPHACGVADSFMAVDAGNKALYFAHQSDKGAPQAWPAADKWPADLRQAMKTALTPPN
ncbi:hypothetical protein ASD44_14010 [Mesorhizobium sp. Root554]|uniref:hypothetical protein n=1 Tax=unclassified Mesorhizobium TaxID=325217 RepID=UPI0006FFC71F|nr:MULTISPECIES: hypothetical protein [unclassified Mesorhizobium]KQZ15047.1 hypothetical protein ASD27_14015 [Mesorhizobium sp. Root1471]KQZ37557.1 hypothetical protein ASD44_14010 [Mesorhizobium sp. Root554]